MRVLPWLLLAAGLACAALAWREWTSDVPPLWSIAAERVGTVVVWAELADVTAPDGQVRQVSRVHVAWPPGASSSRELAGLQLRHDLWHLHTPAEVVRDHPVGSRITVRVVGGQPMADRTDLRALGFVLSSSLLALVLTATGIGLIASGARKREEAEA